MDDSKQNPSQSQSDDGGSLTFTVQQRLFFVVLVATMGALAFGYDTGIISGALPYMTLPAAQGGLDLTPFTEGLVTSALTFGSALGAFISGYVSDRFGRRITLRSLALLFIAGGVRHHGCAESGNHGGDALYSGFRGGRRIVNGSGLYR